MTRPRKDIVSVSETPYYHVITRCVRGAYLCGLDPSADRSYEHRRMWIVDRMTELADIFAISIKAYAVRPSQYHLLLELEPQRTKAWSEQEVIERWTNLYKGPELIQKLKAGSELSEQEKQELSELANVWRERLADLGWFMKNLNQAVARKANKEDRCSGHFWVSRYKSQALMGEEDIARCKRKWDLLNHDDRDEEVDASEPSVLKVESQCREYVSLQRVRPARMADEFA